MRVIQDSWNVPQVFRDRLGETAGRQRLMESEGHLLLILHQTPTEDIREVRACLFWRTPEGEWHSEGGNGFEDLKAHWEDYRRAVDRLEHRITTGADASTFYKALKQLLPLERAVTYGAAVMQEAREHVHSERRMIALRDDAQDIQRQAEILYKEARAGLDYSIARESEEQSKLNRELSESGNRLNLIASFFLPLTALSSLLGMNLSHGMDTQDPRLFWLVLIAGLLIGNFLKDRLHKSNKP